MKNGISARQVRAARVLLNWSQDELAYRAGVALSALARFERDRSEAITRVNTIAYVVGALEKGGVEFIAPHDGSGEGVRLRGPS